MGEPALARPFYTEEEYLRLENESEVRHEYYRGEIIAMAGGSPTHALIVSRICVGLANRLADSSCEVVIQDQRVKTEDGDLTAYPDVVVYCGEGEFDKKDKYALRTPFVLVEVLSPSTANYDRGTKLESYRRIPTLTDYLTVWQDMVRVEHFSRTTVSEDWTFQRYLRRADLVRFHSLDIEVSIEEFYRRLDLPDGALNFQN